MSNVFVLEQLLSTMRDKSTGQAQENETGGVARSVTRQEMEKQMHELARKYVETHLPIRRLERMSVLHLGAQYFAIGSEAA
jgi:fatty acid-binding protein DegV